MVYSGIVSREITHAMVKDQRARITAKKNWNHYFLLTLKSPQIARQAKPGQFVMVKAGSHTHPLLRRPFSIHAREKDSIKIFFQRVGTGTTILSERKRGEALDILGPLGKGFRIDPQFKGKTTFLIGGGRGIAPLYFLSEELISLGASVKVFYGGKSLQDLCLKEKFEQTRVQLFCSTEDGTFGFKGLVTELLTEELTHAHTDILFACGPEAMMEKTARICAQAEIPSEFSLESIMGCGFGACWGCVRKIEKNGQSQWIKICEEGPVFSREEIIW